MSIDLKTCKYKGVEFLFSDMPTTGGNRLIKFNYPNSDAQSIERQGKAPRTFVITAIIPHDDYYNKRDSLLRVLEDGVIGTLTHPTFGDIDNVINGVYTLNERITELGRATITIPFEIDDASGVPAPSKNLASQVAKAGDAVNAQAFSDLSDIFGVDLSFTGNFNDAIDKVNDLGQSFAKAAQVVTPIVDLSANFRQLVTTMVSTAGALIQAPAALSDSIGDIFESLNTLYDLPEQVFGVMGSLFNYGDNDTDINQITSGLTQRKSNRDIMNSTIQLVSIQYAYTAAATTEFSNTLELQNTQEILEQQYLKLRNGGNSGFELSNEAIELLDIQRVAAQDNFDQQLVDTNGIITINVRTSTPLSVVLYNYYGHTDYMQQIIEINEIDLNAFIKGDIDILVDAQ